MQEVSTTWYIPRSLISECTVCFSPSRAQEFAWLGYLSDFPIQAVKSSDQPKIGESDLKPLELAAPNDHKVHVLTTDYVFEFDGNYYSRRRGYQSCLRERAFKVYNSIQRETPSGRPIFPLCRSCFLMIPYYLKFRTSHHNSSKPNWLDLDDVYASIDFECRGVSSPKELADSSTVSARPTVIQLTDPCVPIASLPEYILSKLQQVPGQVEGTDETQFAPISSGLIFSGKQDTPQLSYLQQVPYEVLRMIADDLDAVSCFSMRLTCRTFANAIALDQRFWYNKLIGRSLFGFIFDYPIVKAVDEIRKKSKKQGKVPPQWDWRQMVKLLGRSASFRQGGSLEDAPNPFVTRRTIWAVMEHMEKLLPETSI